MASRIKHRRTTLERIEKALSSQFFSDVNIYSRLYDPGSFHKVELFHCAADALGEAGVKIDPSKAEFEPANVGDSFGPTWSIHWFKVATVVPKTFYGKEVHLQWDSSAECLLFSSQMEPLQAFSGSPGHQRRCEYIVSRCWTETEEMKIDFYIEMQCCDMFGAGNGGFIEPPGEDKTYEVKMAQIAVFDRVMYNIFRDLELLYDYAKSYGDDDAADEKGYQALYAGNEMLNAIHKGALTEAQEIADIFFSEGNGRKAHTIHAIGHCHIDSAWLWNYEVSKRKCARSWISTMKLMEDYEHFTFACSQAQQFQWVMKCYPDIYEKIKHFVKSGRFIPVGGTWVEMDGNIPSGESFVRQFLYGQKFFQKEFGIKCKEFWLPDTFGYSAQIPQILQHVGISRFLTQKLSWSLVNKFPHHNFFWEGIDGSSVLVHFPPGDSYEANCKVAEALKTVRNLKDKGRVRQSMMLFGYGDGGGGPTWQMIERLNRLKDVDGIPKMQSSSPDIFFSKLEEDSSKLCRWKGELYLELHNGTYTSQAAMKELNRKCEAELQKAEFLVVVSLLTNSLDQPAALELSSRLETAWKDVLLNQFHDVLPGSSIKQAHDDAEELFRKALSTCEGVSAHCLDSIKESRGASSVVINSLQWSRNLKLEGKEIEVPGFGIAITGSTEALRKVGASKGKITKEEASTKDNARVSERLILGTLNKLAESNFQKLSAALFPELTTSNVQLLASMIHKKALLDSIFRKLYARLTRCLDEMGQSSVPLKLEMAHIVLSYFEDGISEIVSRAALDQFEKRRKEHLQLANLNFICELFLERALSRKTVSSLLRQIVEFSKNGNELSLEMACSILISTGLELSQSLPKSDSSSTLEEAVASLRNILVTTTLQRRIQFLILDVLDLEANRWIPRKNRTNLEVCVKASISNIPAAGAVERFAQKADVEVTEKDGLFVLQNEFLRAKIDTYGRIQSLARPHSSFEYVTEGKPMNQLVIFEDIPLYWDAWDCMDYHLETRKPMNVEEANVTALKIIEASSIRVVLQWGLVWNEGTDRECKLTQDIILDRGSEYLEFSSVVDWHENRRFLKVEFPSSLNVDEAIYEIQYGLLKRPTHVNTSWDWARFEVCGHKWAALSEPDHGFAVLNDSKYGWSAREGMLSLSLLRSPKSPDKFCDMRQHKFRYALMPFSGPLQSSRVVQRAREYNSSLEQRGSFMGITKTHQWFSIESDLPVCPVVLDTVKLSERMRDNPEEPKSVILRLYEAHGTRGKISISTRLPFVCYQSCDGLEQALEEAVALNTDGELKYFDVQFKPFQIRSFILS